jgi:hypothetical protein
MVSIDPCALTLLAGVGRLKTCKRAASCLSLVGLAFALLPNFIPSFEVALVLDLPKLWKTEC